MSILNPHLPRIVKWCQWPVVSSGGLHTDSKDRHTRDFHGTGQMRSSSAAPHRYIRRLASRRKNRNGTDTRISACVVCSQRCAGLQTSRRGIGGQCATLKPLRHRNSLSHHTVFSRHACCLDSRTHVSRRRQSAGAEGAAGS